MANDLEKKVGNIVRERGGKYILLADGFSSASDFLKVQCRGARHTWLPRISSILKGEWCPKCKAELQASGLGRVTARGGRRGNEKAIARLNKAIASITGLDASIKMLQIQCRSGHEFSCSLEHALKNSECPECARSEDFRPRRESSRLQQSIQVQ